MGFTINWDKGSKRCREDNPNAPTHVGGIPGKRKGNLCHQLLKLIILLEKAQIFRLLYYKNSLNPKSLVKPQKILFDNTSLLFALGNENIGKVRETFIASMVGESHKIGYPKNGDLIIENRYLLEIGGRSKDFRQIADIPDSFLALDDIDFGIGNRIPMWLFGFLY